MLSPNISILNHDAESFLDVQLQSLQTSQMPIPWSEKGTLRSRLATVKIDSYYIARVLLKMYWANLLLELIFVVKLNQIYSHSKMVLESNVTTLILGHPQMSSFANIMF